MREGMRNISFGFASKEDLRFLFEGKYFLETLQIKGITANNIATLNIYLMMSRNKRLRIMYV
jgi:hypothetical protein